MATGRRGVAQPIKTGNEAVDRALAQANEAARTAARQSVVPISWDIPSTAAERGVLVLPWPAFLLGAFFASPTAVAASTVDFHTLTLSVRPGAFGRSDTLGVYSTSASGHLAWQQNCEYKQVRTNRLLKRGEIITHTKVTTGAPTAIDIASLSLWLQPQGDG